MKTLQQHRARPQRWLATLTIALLALGAPLATAAPAFASAVPAIEQPAEQPAEPIGQPEADAPAEPVAAEPVPEAPAEVAGDADAAPAIEAPAEAPPAPPALAAPAPVVAASAPVVTVSEAPRAGGTVTVRGTGFAAAKPGVYVGLGGEGLPGFYLGSAKLVASETTFVAPGNVLGTGAQGRTAPLEEDGSFEFTVTVPALSAGTPSYAIYTSKAHGQGMSDKSQDTTTVIRYAPLPKPVVTVSEAPRAGGAVTVRGTGFAATKPGIYVGLGTAGLPGFYMGGSGLVTSEITFVAPGNVLGSGAQGKTAPMNADGSFEFSVTVPAFSEAKPSYAIYTSKAHGQGMSDTSQDSSTVIAYAPIPAPTVTVSKTSGLDAQGDTVIVTGTGFLPT
ncbi:hypothetical protein ACFYYK_41320, partial [Kitasatospora indigofera]